MMLCLSINDDVSINDESTERCVFIITSRIMSMNKLTSVNVDLCQENHA